ncbi:MAG: hypothetical protein PHQ22_10370 [Sulfuricurvum sp.]|jgi:cell division protein FtsB|nr:hypothetical protein [Sulfuricurvum sp.]
MSQFSPQIIRLIRENKELKKRVEELEALVEKLKEVGKELPVADTNQENA